MASDERADCPPPVSFSSGAADPEWYYEWSIHRIDPDVPEEEMKFLVVDDSATMRRIVINSLKRIGYDDFVEAVDGAEALNSLDPSVDFVITDWNMPNMGGLDFVRALRERDDVNQVPVLMVTMRSVREDIMRAAEAGANNYVVKPFTPQVLTPR